jgi:multiple sugar transport system substrate-binding protein
MLEFWSLDIVSYFVFRISDFKIVEFNKTTLLYIGVPIAVLLLISIAWFGFKSSPLSSVNLVMWGFEDSHIYDDLLRDLKGKYPNIGITYVQKSQNNYEKQLLDAMASGSGPDIFPVYHTWLPFFKDKISPVPANMTPLKTYYDTFVDVATQDFVADGSIWGVPFYVDSLALYWNKDFFNSVGIPEPPKNWDDFMADVEKLTVKDGNGNITRAGAALGTALNVNASSDILSLLMLQTGTKMVDDQKSQATFNLSIILNGENYDPAISALEFYTQFAMPQKEQSTSNPGYTWNSKMENSLESFESGKAVMMVDYSTAAAEIAQKYPYLNFAIAPMPQVKDASVSVNYADYWAQSVWVNSKHPKEAWQAIFALADSDLAEKYLTAVKKPVGRRDLVNWQKDDPTLGVFATQSLSARSWYQADNNAISDIFKQMIESVASGQSSPRDVIESAAYKVTSLMRDTNK